MGELPSAGTSSATAPGTPPPSLTDASPGDPPDTVTTGVLVVEGDADAVSFVAAALRYPAGPVPPGEYVIEATFGADTVAAGNVRVEAGQAVHVRCVRQFRMCRGAVHGSLPGDTPTR
jgi:hypothetical protein